MRYADRLAVAQRIDLGSCPWSPTFVQVLPVKFIVFGREECSPFFLFVFTEILNNVLPTKVSDSSSRRIHWSDKLLALER